MTDSEKIIKNEIGAKEHDVYLSDIAPDLKNVLVDGIPYDGSKDPENSRAATPKKPDYDGE